MSEQHLSRPVVAGFATVGDLADHVTRPIPTDRSGASWATSRLSTAWTSRCACGWSEGWFTDRAAAAAAGAEHERIAAQAD